MKLRTVFVIPSFSALSSARILEGRAITTITTIVPTTYPMVIPLAASTDQRANDNMQALETADNGGSTTISQVGSVTLRYVKDPSSMPTTMSTLTDTGFVRTFIRTGYVGTGTAKSSTTYTSVYTQEPTISLAQTSSKKVSNGAVPLIVCGGLFISFFVFGGACALFRRLRRRKQHETPVRSARDVYEKPELPTSNESLEMPAKDEKDAWRRMFAGPEKLRELPGRDETSIRHELLGDLMERVELPAWRAPALLSRAARHRR